MKNKKNKLLSIVTVAVFVFGLLFVTDKTYAACCVSSCTAPLHDGKCARVETPDSRDCSAIDSCKSNNNTNTGTNTATTGSATFINPLSFNSIESLLESVMNNLQGLLVTLAILFIVLGGVMYILSAGNEKMITRAKACWTGAVIGLAIALAAPTFLKEVRTILGATGTSGNAQVEAASTLSQIALRALNFLLAIIGIIAILALVVGGGMYLTSYGDQKRIDSAKQIITYAIIGIVVALGAVVIVRQVGVLIGVQWN